MTKVIDEMAPVVLDAITKAENILLHCHPSPDPDSVGSVLAMKLALEQLGKKVTAIQGDSAIPQAFMHFPGASTIVKKNFGEVSLSDFDLFIILDSGSPEMISVNKPSFPLPIKSLVIDHHASNTSYADINLIDIASPATAYILFNLFKKWGIKIDHDIALNLFMGIFTDTGGFRYAPTNHLVLKAASELTEIAPDFTKAIFLMDNCNVKEAIYFQAIALNSVQLFLNGTLAIAPVSYKSLEEKNIPEECIRGDMIASLLKSVVGWNLGISMVEKQPGKVKISCRTRDSEKFDVSKLAVALGGGGHRAAAGARLNMPLDEAIKKVVETAKVLYNL
jgi:phosphoesterase RecJ-like protein